VPACGQDRAGAGRAPVFGRQHKRGRAAVGRASVAKRACGRWSIRRSKQASVRAFARDALVTEKPGRSRPAPDPCRAYASCRAGPQLRQQRYPHRSRVAGAAGSLLRPASGVGGEQQSDREVPQWRQTRSGHRPVMDYRGLSIRAVTWATTWRLLQRRSGCVRTPRRQLLSREKQSWPESHDLLANTRARAISASTRKCLLEPPSSKRVKNADESQRHDAGGGRSPAPRHPKDEMSRERFDADAIGSLQSEAAAASSCVCGASPGARACE
jgi:hypothetical protein